MSSADLDVKSNGSDVSSPRAENTHRSVRPLHTVSRFSIKAAVDDVSQNRMVYLMAASAALGMSILSVIHMSNGPWRRDVLRLGRWPGL